MPRRRTGNLDGRNLEIRPLTAFLWGVLKYEPNLKQWVVTECALGLFLVDELMQEHALGHNRLCRVWFGLQHPPQEGGRRPDRVVTSVEGPSATPRRHAHRRL